MGRSTHGINFTYAQDANKPVVVLVHPLGMNLSVWDKMCKVLSDQFSVLTFDLPGHGLSAPFAPDIQQLTNDEFLGCFWRLLDELGISIFHFVGTSIGGLLGQHLLVNAPDRLLSVMLTNTGMAIGTEANWLDRQKTVLEQGLATMAPGIVERWFSKNVSSLPENAYLVPHWVDALSQTDDRSYGLLCAWIGQQDMAPLLASTDLPISVVAGSDDIATPPEKLQELAEKLNKDVTLLKGIGHVPSVESPAHFSELLLHFLGTANKK